MNQRGQNEPTLSWRTKFSHFKAKKAYPYVRTKALKVLNNRKIISRWQAFTAYRSASSGLKENVFIFDFIWKIAILYNIIVLCGFEVLMFCTSMDDIYFTFWSYCILLLTFYSNFIVKPHKAHVSVQRSIIVGKPPEAQMLWCWGHLFCF